MIGNLVIRTAHQAIALDAGNFTAYKVAAAHGAGRIEFGTYEFSLADIPDTVADLRARYPGVAL